MQSHVKLEMQAQTRKIYTKMITETACTNDNGFRYRTLVSVICTIYFLSIYDVIWRKTYR